MSASSGKLFLHAIVQEKKVATLHSFGKITHLFKPNEKVAYDFIVEFASQHHAIPSADTVEAHTGEALQGAKEPPSYYLEIMKDRHVELEVKKTLKAANDQLTVANKNPKKALDILLQNALELNAMGQTHMVSDFRHSKDALLQAYAAKFNGTTAKLAMLGWETFDEMSGGIGVGDMVSKIGRPAKGKTWQMLYSCLFGWNKVDEDEDDQKPASRMFVSMEMPKLQIEMRLASMVAKLPHMKIKNAALTSKQFDKYSDALTVIEGFGAPFYVVDGNLTATVDDIHSLAVMLNPDGIWIDGGYLVKHPTERDRFKRVAENADMMKTKLAPIAPLVVSWQFSKTGAKKGKEKKDGVKPDLEDIGYSDAIAQVSSIVLGITEPESVETIQSRQLDILKGRNGEVGGFRTNWNFHTRDFSEMKEQNLEDLNFL